ncbi:hypothetical protein HGA13_32485 [Nocardia speluncae]|uniref:Uncharacterized protein n=1 Tax=Nocardia speluncae TaxID=419477 RepID=A0A846XTF2_9NOCA|nr:hypothetical protein [Nocardia speluncae]NKY37753.1 hypothetical protein [Nocardia speluncae]
MRSLRSRGVRRYGATRPPRGVRAEVLVKSSLGSWELQPAETTGSDRKVSNSRPAGARGSTAPAGRSGDRRANNPETEPERSSN